MDFQVAPVTVEPIDHGLKLVFHGSIHTNVAWLERELKNVVAAKPKRVEIDLTDVASVSSLGVGVLVSLRNGVVGGGGAVKIVAVQKLTYSTFRFARLEKMFQIEPSAILSTAKAPETKK